MRRRKFIGSAALAAFGASITPGRATAQDTSAAGASVDESGIDPYFLESGNLAPAERNEIEEFELGGAEDAAQKAKIELWRFPIPDREVPLLRDVEAVVDRAVSALHDCRNVAFHCRQGIGRSGIMAAATIIRLGETADFALECVSSARGRGVPDTVEQEQWVREFEKCSQ